MSWLPKEVLDHLEHAGYVAVPREQVETIYAEETVSQHEMHLLATERSFVEHLYRRMAQTMSRVLLERGFIKVLPITTDRDVYDCVRQRAELTVLKPR